MVMLVIFGLVKIIEAVRLGSVTRFVPPNALLGAIAIVGLILAFRDQGAAGYSNWPARTVACVYLALIIVMISGIMPIYLLGAIVMFLAVIFVAFRDVANNGQLPRP